MSRALPKQLLGMHNMSGIQASACECHLVDTKPVNCSWAASSGFRCFLLPFYVTCLVVQPWEGEDESWGSAKRWLMSTCNVCNPGSCHSQQSTRLL